MSRLEIPKQVQIVHVPFLIAEALKNRKTDPLGELLH